ncbi:excinuclease ABC subunit UvrA [Candidatus Peregrinibacteria bacterium]|jgi:excinuclease ABC subunit A|nr:excinuclease ABC subunit UvrA [Candidatus Peregrinibacteria bacterium]
MSQKNIVVRGAKMHNLKNIDIEIPRDKLVVVTGVSGSGKSTLAFDTIYAEGQRRYVESLSTYARQFLQMTQKPEVESIEGLSPAISIDQKSASRNPRSTVGTITEIYDYLRLFYAKLGKAHCLECGNEISKQSMAEIVESISKFPLGKKVMILAPQVTNAVGSHIKAIEKIKKEGFIRMRIDGELRTVNEEIELDAENKHSIDIVIDRIVIKDYSPKQTTLSTGVIIEESNPDRTRLADSIELALKHGDGTMRTVDFETEEEQKFSETFSCPEHPEIEIPEIEPRSFSFNSPHGACKQCHGLGNKLVVQEDLVMPNSKLTIEEGGIHPLASYTWHINILKEVGKKFGFTLQTKVKDLTKKQKEIILNGTGDDLYEAHFESKKLHGEFKTRHEGVVPNLERRYLETDSESSKKQIEKYMEIQLCPRCKGRKLRAEVLGITINKKNIVELTELSIKDFHTFFNELEDIFGSSEQKIARPILEQIRNRIKFLKNVGLSYLNLNRSASTLSGGEAQRIRLATQIGSALLGVLYVLDEPSIGLHQRDNDRLIETLKSLRDIGNTVLVVEHDEDTMKAADHIIEIGPEAGQNGGMVVAEGTVKAIMSNKKSVTGAFLSGREEISVPMQRRQGNGNFLEIRGARAHNLQNIHAKIPLGLLLGISGVSGSGKSTLINGVLGAELAHKLNRAESRGLEHDEILGIEHLDKIIHIDQSPIGRTPRSNPATYTGVFTDIRELFAGQPDSKLRGYNAGRFSFNVKGGRCEACAGDGMKKIEMHFLADIYVPCDVCHGKRYNQEALEIKWRGHSISDVLHMTVTEAVQAFTSIPSIKNKLEILEDVGLGYIHLGQSATTLSGGEAQRVKLSTELARRATGKTIYVLDEPTTGLHFQDIKKLLEVLQRLVDKGNSILLIEHNLDVLKTCDHIIDIGPEGGSGGGKVIATGTPEEIAEVEASHTGTYLKKLLK